MYHLPIGTLVKTRANLQAEPTEARTIRVICQAEFAEARVLSLHHYLAAITIAKNARLLSRRTSTYSSVPRINAHKKTPSPSHQRALWERPLLHLTSSGFFS